ncbi:MAG: hypothetical protein U9N18_03970 [Campylobacterota bacterium]|nr:hypothetical protein [Campylobacterota bacterium]MEA2066007.1 hypothetical protein [Thermotogota bacterium]
MNRNEKKKQVIRSMIEFERKYFPKSFEKRMTEKPTDARALGICLAKESLDKIKRQLSK